MTRPRCTRCGTAPRLWSRPVCVYCWDHASGELAPARWHNGVKGKVVVVRDA